MIAIYIFIGIAIGITIQIIADFFQLRYFKKEYKNLNSLLKAQIENLEKTKIGNNNGRNTKHG